MICLTHIPKTGGTTFRYILINNYSWRHYDFPESKKKFVNLSEYPFNSCVIRHIKSMSGHWLRYSDNTKHLVPDLKFIVFLRDPIMRIISLFFHIQRYENSGINFKKWVENEYKGPILSNFQTKYIAGDNNLELAKSILQNGYFFVGLTELFDESLLILRKKLGVHFDVRYVIKRYSKNRSREILNDNYNKKSLEKLYEHNDLDLQLYKYVKNDLFSMYQREHGYISEKEIGEFRKHNNCFAFNRSKVMTFRLVKYIFYLNIHRLHSYIK